MSVVPGPWGTRGGPRRPSPPPPPNPRGPVFRAAGPATPRQQLIWNLVSSLLLLGILALYMGPYVAIGGLVGVLVHEYGHVLAMNALGCGPARIVIIPFLGGAAIPARPASTEFKDVIISLAGPVFGLLAMIPFVALAFATGNREWFAAAFFVAFINLLNLFPAPPLDGSKAVGPVLARIHPQVERVFLMLIGGAAVLWAVSRGSLLMALFLGIGVISALRSGPLRHPAMRLTGVQSAGAVALYAASAALCLGALGGSLVSLGMEPSLGSVARIFGFD